jgi:phage tail sheath protein FI
MPITPTYPGIYIEEIQSSAHTITAAPTNVAVLIGYTHPFKTRSFGTPVRLFSFTDYERQFGGFFYNQLYDFESAPFGSVAHAVNQFFLNGGSECYVVGLPQVTGGTPFPAATQVVGGISFTAREPTDATHELWLEIKPKPVSLASPPMSPPASDIADIIITYGAGAGAVVETFRGVSLGPDKLGTPLIKSQIGTADKPVSSLVTVAEPTAMQPYPPTFTSDRQKFPYAPAKGSTIFNPNDFTKVFQADSPLDKLAIFNLMVLPGVTENGILSEAAAFCEGKRAFLIIDPPSTVSADGFDGRPAIEDFVEGNTVPSNPPPKEKNAAIYFPYIRSTDPTTGNGIELPPGGTVAGVFASTDLKRGVWKAPAGLETPINNTTGVVDRGKMTDQRQGVLNQIAVNCLRDFRAVGTVVFGARTLVGQDANTAQQQWKYVPVRRMALFLEQTLYNNLGWVVFEPNDEPLWAAIRTSIEAFMLGLFRQGAFQGSTPSQAFQVKCDNQTTTQADIDNGIVNIVVAFAPLKPAEFVIIKIAQLAGQTQTS